MRLVAIIAAPIAACATTTSADGPELFDTDATIDAGRINTCLRRPHDDPHHCIGIEAATCYERPSSAPNASVAALRCDYAEMNLWQGSLDANAALLTQNLRGPSLAAFQDQQSKWEQDTTPCGFPFNVIHAPVWPAAKATHCALRRLADRAIEVKSYVTDYLEYCEFPAADMQPDFPC